jgi:hypothetical protein
MHKEREYLEFEKEIMFFQELFSKCQIEAIKRTLTIIETKTTAMLQGQINENIIRSIEWCTQHDIEINEFYKDNTPETQLTVLTTELLNVGSLLPSRTRSDITAQPFPSRRYLQEQFQPQLRIDAASALPTPSSQTVQSISGELLDRNQALESWQTTEETRSGSWEIVRRQQRGAWKGVPP